MVRSCSVHGCKSGYRKSRKNNTSTKPDFVRVYSFPRDESKCKEWLRSIPHKDLTYEKIQAKRHNIGVCIKHFDLGPDDLDCSGPFPVPKVLPTVFTTISKSDQPSKPTKSQVKSVLTDKKMNSIQGRGKVRSVSVANKDIVSCNSHLKTISMPCLSLAYTRSKGREVILKSDTPLTITVSIDPSELQLCVKNWLASGLISLDTHPTPPQVGKTDTKSVSKDTSSNQEILLSRIIEDGFPHTLEKLDNVHLQSILTMLLTQETVGGLVQYGNPYHKPAWWPGTLGWRDWLTQGGTEAQRGLCAAIRACYFHRKLPVQRADPAVAEHSYSITKVAKSNSIAQTTADENDSSGTDDADETCDAPVESKAKAKKFKLIAKAKGRRLCTVCKEPLTTSKHYASIGNIHLKCMKENIVCTICGKSYKAIKFNVHLKSHEYRNKMALVTCHICGLSMNAESLGRHLRKVHKGKKDKFKDIKRDKTYAVDATTGLLRRVAHLKPGYGKSKGMCSICGQIYKQGLEMHNKTFHAASNPYECKVCNTRYKSEGSLIRHFSMKHTEGNALPKRRHLTNLSILPPLSDPLPEPDYSEDILAGLHEGMYFHLREKILMQTSKFHLGKKFYLSEDEKMRIIEYLLEKFPHLSSNKNEFDLSKRLLKKLDLCRRYVYRHEKKARKNPNQAIHPSTLPLVLSKQGCDEYLSKHSTNTSAKEGGTLESSESESSVKSLLKALKS